MGTRLLRAVAIVLVGLLGPCMPGRPKDPPVPDPPPAPVNVATIAVTTTPEPNRASTATLGAAGGSITATGADGTRYRLIVPPGALTTDVAITVTPSAVGGLGRVAREVAAGVTFSPSGLRFARPASLDVALAAGRTLPDGVLFSSTHRSGGPGLEFPPATVSDDRASVRMQIAHFSGASVWTGTVDQLGVLWEAVWADVPSIIEKAPGFVAASKAAVQALQTPPVGDPVATAAAYVTEAVKVYQEVVLPLIAAADDSIDDALVARKAAVRFAGHLAEMEALGVDTEDLATPIDGATNVEMLRPLALNGVVTAIGRLRDTYLQPRCTAQVVVLADWLNLPSFLGLVMDFTVNQEDGWIPKGLCVRAVASGPVFDPAVLDQDDRVVGVRADVVTAVPAQTPLPAGSTTRLLPDGRIGVVTPAQLEVSATGGAFVQGDATVETLTASLPDGTFTGSVDRGEDPALRPLELAVQGRFRLDGPAGVLKLIAEVIDDWDTAVLEGGAVSNELGLQVERWDAAPPAVPVDERILEPGGTTNVCVVVRDRLGATVSGISVGFSTEGPGTVDTTLKVSEASEVANGTACTEYEHPDGPVPAGLTARIEVEAQKDADIGRTTIVLQPREADVRLAARVLPDGAFVPVASNGSFPSGAGDAVEVRVSLRGSGATPADELVPVVDGDLVATLDDGAGILTVDGIPAVPLALTTGPDGTATFRWEPNGDEPAVIRVAHPADGPGVSATVTVGPDPTTIDGDVVVRTDAEVAELAGVTRINGSLTIGIFNRSIDPTISTVSDLSPLGSLTVVTGALTVRDNPDLVDLDGLDDLVSVGGRLTVDSNPALQGLDALTSVETAGALLIAALPLVTDLDGLGGLTSVPGQVAVASNPALTDITALANLSGTIGQLTITRNPVLTSVDGLQGVTGVADSLRVDGPALTSLDGLSSLTTIGGEVEITNDADVYGALTVYSLPALTSIGTNLDINGAGMRSVGSEIVDAPKGSITTFHFPSLTQIGRRFRLGNHRDGAQVQIVTAPTLRVERSMEVFDNGSGAVITVSVAEVAFGVAITSNDDARLELRIERVVGDGLGSVDVAFNVDTDIQLDIDTVDGDVRVGGRRTASSSPGNVGVALAGLRIGAVSNEAFNEVRVEDNVGFTDAQALAWAAQSTALRISVSGNRLA